MNPVQVRVPCDHFSGCTTSFTRKQDMERHKYEYHEQAKHCPWCEYNTKRDQRMLEHIDDNHRPRKHKRHAEDSNSHLPSQRRSESPRARGEIPFGATSGSSTQGHAAFGTTASGPSYLSSHRRIVSQQANFDNAPTAASRSSGLQPYTGGQVTLEEVSMMGGNSGPALAMRPLVMPGSEGRQVVGENTRNVVIKSRRGSSNSSAPARNAFHVPIVMSPTVEHSTTNQAAQGNQLQAYSMTQPEIQFGATPSTYLPYGTQSQFYEGYPIPFLPHSQPSPSFTVPLSTSPSRSYMPPSPYLQRHNDSSSLYSQPAVQSQPSSNSASFRQDQSSALSRGEDGCESRDW